MGFSWDDVSVGVQEEGGEGGKTARPRKKNEGLAGSELQGFGLKADGGGLGEKKVGGSGVVRRRVGGVNAKVFLEADDDRIAIVVDDRSNGGSRCEEVEEVEEEE